MAASRTPVKPRTYENCVMKCTVLQLYVMYAGLVQLEALEILSSSSEQKVRRFMEMLQDAAESLKSELLQMRQVFDDVHASSDDGLLNSVHCHIHWFVLY